MTVTGLKFLTNEAKKLATVATGISKKVITTSLRIIFNVAVFPFIFVYGGVVYASNWFLTCDSENADELQPRSDLVCRNTRQLRNTAMSNMIAMSSTRSRSEKNASTESKCRKRLDIPDLNVEDRFSSRYSESLTVAPMEINEFSGEDILWEIPVISAKAKYFAQCVKEERCDDIVNARKALEHHHLEAQTTETRQIFNDMKNEAENKHEVSEASVINLNYAETRNTDNCDGNDSVDSGSFEGMGIQKREFCSYDASIQISQRRKTKCFYNPLLTHDKITCRERYTAKSFRKVQAACSKLLGEISNLNEALNKVIAMREKLTNLEFQVDEGKKLMLEIESERSSMESKLLDLAELIEEQEEFFSRRDFSESGFYESVETTGES